MRILQSLYDGGGNVPPQLAITSRLVAHGHDVHVLAHETLRDRVEERGARLTPFRRTLPGHDMTRRETDLVRDWEPDDPMDGVTRFRDQVLFGPALANAREVLGLMDEWPADVIVLDWLLFGTALAAERAQVPSVALVHCLYPLRTDGGLPDEFFAPGLETINEARAALRLRPLDRWDQQLLNADTVFVLTARELDPAGALDLPPNVRFVGAALEPVPATWQSPWPATNTDPLVVMSFSTTYMNQRDLAERVLQAVAELPVRGLLTTGPALDVDGLQIPDNVHVAAFVPHATLMTDAALVVTHAGFGTVQAALVAGVPLVCLPCARDQPANAARVAELGVGRAVDTEGTVPELRAAIAGALADPELEAAAGRMAATLRRDDGAAAVVERIEALA